MLKLQSNSVKSSESFFHFLVLTLRTTTAASMYMSVQEQEEANSVFKLFETRPSCAGAELGSFTSFSVCMFKLRFVFVCSGAGGREGELGSVLLSERHGLFLGWPQPVG